MPGTDSRSCSAAARRVAALGERRIFTAASLRVAAGLLADDLLVDDLLVDDLLADGLLAAGVVFRVVDASVRGLRALGALFAADDRGAALRVVRDVLLLAAAGLRAVVDAARFGVREAAAFVVREGAVAVFAGRVGVLRAGVAVLARVVPVRAAEVRVVLRVDAVRAVAGRAVVRAAVVRAAAVRFAGAAAFARVVAFGAALVADALVLVAAVRVVLARVVDVFVARGAFAAALAFGPGFFAVVVRGVVPRALLPAARRPPAFIAMARVRRPPVVSSVLMLEIPRSVGKRK